MPGKTLSTDEVRLVKQWAVQDSEAPSEIARRLGRSKSTITRFLKQRSPPKRRGVKVVACTVQCILGRTCTRMRRSGRVFQSQFRMSGTDLSCSVAQHVTPHETAAGYHV